VPHRPIAHAGAALAALAHARPHAPQFATSVFVATSQPFAALASQSAWPAVHTSPHAPAAHVGIELVPLGHAWPHAPQLPVSIAVATSQPLVAAPSQSAKPGSQLVAAHAPAAHTGRAWVSAHAWPHAPQFAPSLPVSAHAPAQHV
jgi:hypothetical protein